MASSSRGLSALELHQQYETILSEQPLCDCPSPYLLHAALTRRSPPISVSYAAVRQWWGKYRVTPGGISLDSVEALEQQYGDDIRHIAQEHNTAFKLCKALRSRDPPVFVSDAVAKHWLRRYARSSAKAYVDSVGHLEQYYGDILRAQGCSNGEEVCKWLLAEHSVSVPVRVCVKWLSSEWSSSNRIMSADSLEQVLGEESKMGETH